MILDFSIKNSFSPTLPRLSKVDYVRNLTVSGEPIWKLPSCSGKRNGISAHRTNPTNCAGNCAGTCERRKFRGSRSSGAMYGQKTRSETAKIVETFVRNNSPGLLPRIHRALKSRVTCTLQRNNMQLSVSYIIC